MSGTAINATWEALPQRKRSRCRSDTKSIITSELDSSSVASFSPLCPSSSSSSSSTSAATREEARSQAVSENIRARSEKKRIAGSLDSKDGCAGEFYEYLDHTADVQCHSWGKTLKDAFENMGPCMFNYMTDLSTVAIDESKTILIEAKGHDMQSLLFNFMDEMLFRFCTEAFICAKLEIVRFDRDNFQIDFKAHGNIFDQAIHPQGTEIKAITYSNMQIHETEDRADIYVIVDI